MHLNSILSPVESLPAANVFDDSILHYDDTNPQGSVIHPNTGTIIDVHSMDSNGFIQIQVRSAKSSKNK